MAYAYNVVDAQTSKVVRQFNTSTQAYDYADSRDRAYGAVRYRVERDYEVMTSEEFEVFMARVRAE